MAGLLVGCLNPGDGTGAPRSVDSGLTSVSSIPSVPTTTADSAETSTSAPSTTSTTEAPPKPRQPVTVAFAGDTSFTNGLDQRDPFADVVDLLSDPDLTVVNLETAVASPDVGRPFVDKQFLFKSPPESLQLLVDAGIDVVGLANNHIFDFGPDAVAQTLHEVDRYGLARVGAGNTSDEAYAPLVIEVGEWRVGLVALSRVPCDWSASGENVRPWVAWACPVFIDLADEMVAATVAVADVTFVMVHGGAEGELCPSDFMVEQEQRWSELGADAVLNGHPHVVQGITSWGDTIVAHSTGNFAFPSARGVTANSAIFIVEVAEDGLELRVEPVRVDSGIVTRPSASQRAEIIAQINRVSSGWQLDDDGVARRAQFAGDC